MKQLFKTFQIKNMEKFKHIIKFIEFVTILASRKKGFEVMVEMKNYSPLITLACLDPSVVMKPIFDRFHSVLLTSKNMTSLDYYPKLLGQENMMLKSLDGT
jgi:DNA excision repair protein ERCC-2